MGRRGSGTAWRRNPSIEFTAPAFQGDPAVSSRHGHCRHGRHFVRRGLAEDFEKQRADVEVSLALGTAANTLIGSVGDQIFELFSHDLVFIRWFRDFRQRQSSVWPRLDFVRFSMRYHCSTSVSTFIDVPCVKSGPFRFVNIGQSEKRNENLLIHSVAGSPAGGVHWTFS